MSEIILPNTGAAKGEPTNAEIAAGVLALARAISELQEAVRVLSQQQVALLNAVATMDFVASEIAPYLNGERSIMDSLPPQVRAMLSSMGL